MTDTSTSTPEWLAAAEAEYDKLGGTAELTPAEIERQAAEVNDTLDRLGITPISPATAGTGSVIAAELLAADPERGLWGVAATYEDGAVVLQAEGWEYDDDFRLGEALANRAQVVHVHRNGIPNPAPVRNLRAEALRCAGSVSEHIDHGLYEVAVQIQGLTLAVLALVDSRA